MTNFREVAKAAWWAVFVNIDGQTVALLGRLASSFLSATYVGGKFYGQAERAISNG